MRLSQLLKKDCAPDLEITGLTADSRDVRDGYIFAALQGSANDGVKYIPQALHAGAVGVLVRSGVELDLPDHIILLQDDEPRHLLARLAASFYPDMPNYRVGITGTNGKTSTAQFVSQLWSLLGARGGSLGTLGVDVTGEQGFVENLGHTTPDPVTLHHALMRAKRAGCDFMAMEVSSHGLAQYRCDGVSFQCAAFTNITQDHLDYHDGFEDYFAAKKRLFTKLLNADGVAIVNVDGAGGSDLLRDLETHNVRITTIGRNHCDYSLDKANAIPNGLEISARANGRVFDFVVPLVGAFQAENILLAAAIVVESGFELNDVMGALSKLKGVPGRMMLAGEKNGAAIYVDYAHTPDAIETVLQSVRPHTQGRLIAIIGAGGDRDRGKRPLMGRAARQNADYVILADDNPRFENPAQIRDEILQGAPEASNIGDRSRAIELGVEMLELGDVLLVLGKGHESGQTINGVVHDFDDAKEVAGQIAGLV